MHACSSCFIYKHKPGNKSLTLIHVHSPINYLVKEDCDIVIIWFMQSIVARPDIVNLVNATELKCREWFVIKISKNKKCRICKVAQAMHKARTACKHACA